MFEVQYSELILAVDLIAERNTCIKYIYAPGTYRDFAKLTSIKESESVPKAEDMLQNWWPQMRPPPTTHATFTSS